MSVFSKARDRLWKRNPFCENCGVLTIHPADVPGARLKEDGTLMIKVTPPNMATLQHKYDRLHPKRKAKTKERRWFLWCYKCNHDYHLAHESERSKEYSKQLNTKQ